MRPLAAAVVAILALAATVGAAAVEPVTLDPATPWRYEDREGSCIAARSFGAGRSAVALSLQRFGLARQFRLRATGFPLRLKKRAAITVRFDPDETGHVHQDSWIGGDAEGRGSFMVVESLADAAERRRRGPSHVFREPNPFILAAGAEELRREAAVDRLTLSGPVEMPVTLRLGSMREPMAALRRCAERQLKALGYDPAALAAQSRPIQAVRPDRWVTWQDYPADMLRQRRSSLTSVRLRVDRTGRPTDCRILDPDPPAAFCTLTCKLILERARFDPALDASGRPMDSVFFISANWFA